MNELSAPVSPVTLMVVDDHTLFRRGLIALLSMDEGLQVVALSDLGGPSSLQAVKPVLLDRLAAQFGLEWRPEPALPQQLAA